MPTKNIECQLAQGQIGRYLSGERLSATALKQLEEHVAECEECSELVTRRRQALMAILGEGTTHAAVMAPSGGSGSAVSAKERLMEQINNRTGQNPLRTETAPANAGNLKVSLIRQIAGSKPLLYCAGLAAVLIAMSYFSKDALKTFGPTADSGVATPADQTQLRSKTPIAPASNPGTPVATTAPVTSSTPNVANNATPSTASATGNVAPASTPVSSPVSSAGTHAVNRPATPPSTESQDDPSDQPEVPVIHHVKAKYRAKAKATHPTHHKVRHPAIKRVVHRRNNDDDDDDTPRRSSHRRVTRRNAHRIAAQKSIHRAARRVAPRPTHKWVRKSSSATHSGVRVWRAASTKPSPSAHSSIRVYDANGKAIKD